MFILTNTIFVPIIINKLNLFYEYQVNGSWGEWEQWEDCTASCDGGEQSRIRVCDSPAPAFGGTNCTDDGSSSSETQPCNENNCTGKKNFRHLHSVDNILRCLLIEFIFIFLQGAYIEETRHVLHLENGHFIKCFGGLSVSDTTITCSLPLFDSESIVGSISTSEDGNKMLGIHSDSNTYSASHDWLEKNVGVLFGNNDEVPSRTVQANEQPWGCAGSNTNECCYSDGSLSLYVGSSCNVHENGCNVVTSFSFTYSGGVAHYIGNLKSTNSAFVK